MNRRIRNILSLRDIFVLEYRPFNNSAYEFCIVEQIPEDLNNPTEDVQW